MRAYIFIGLGGALWLLLSDLHCLRAQLPNKEEAARLKQQLNALVEKPFDARADGPLADSLACSLAKNDMAESSIALRRLLLCTAPGGGGKWIWFSFSRYRTEFPQRAASELVLLLRDQDVEVRRRATLELTSIDLGRKEKSRPILRTLAADSKTLAINLEANLDADDEIVRWATIETIVATGLPQAKKALLQAMVLLSQKQPPRPDMFTALPFHGGGREAFGDNWGSKIAAMAPRDSAGHIAQAMKGCDSDGRKRLLVVARRLATSADADKSRLAGIFAQGLDDKIAANRIVALEGIQQLRKDGASAREAIARLLKDPSIEIRVSALEALISIEDEPSDRLIANMRKLLASGDAAAVGRILPQVARIGPAARPITPELTVLAKDPTSSHRLAAATALLQVDESATEIAVKALAEIAGKMKPSEAPPWQLIRRLGPAAKPALPALVAAFERAKSGRRDAWAIALISVDPSASISAKDHLRKRLLEKDADHAMVSELRKLGSGGRLFLPELISILRTSEDVDVLVETLQVTAALGTGATDAIAAIETLLDHRSRIVRQTANAALKEIRSMGKE